MIMRISGGLFCVVFWPKYGQPIHSFSPTLGILEAELKTSLKPLEHHITMVSRGIRGTLKRQLIPCDSIMIYFIMTNKTPL